MAAQPRPSRGRSDCGEVFFLIGVIVVLLFTVHWRDSPGGYPPERALTHSLNSLTAFDVSVHFSASSLSRLKHSSSVQFLFLASLYVGKCGFIESASRAMCLSASFSRLFIRITRQWWQPLERLRLFCILAGPLQRSAHFQVRPCFLACPALDSVNDVIRQSVFHAKKPKGCQNSF